MPSSIYLWWWICVWWQSPWTVAALRTWQDVMFYSICYYYQAFISPISARHTGAEALLQWLTHIMSELAVAPSLCGSYMGFAPITSLKTCISAVTDLRRNFYHRFDRCMPIQNVIKIDFGGCPRLHNAPFSKFKIAHFGVPIPSAASS